jgi:prenyltransferase beta subunit
MVACDNVVFASLTMIVLLLVTEALAFGAAPKEPIDARTVVEYVLNCRKPNGAFGPVDQEYTDAAWNYPAVKTLRLLGAKVDRPQAILQHGLGYPRGHIGYGHWLFFHQHEIRRLLDAPPAARNKKIRLVHQGHEVRYYGSPFGTDGDSFFKAGGAGLDPRDDDAEESGFYNLSSLFYVLAGLKASGRSASNVDQLVAFVHERQTSSGGFVDVRGEIVKPMNHAVHVAHTFHAIALLKMLGADIPATDRCERLLQSCQQSSGAFRWNPNGAASGNYPDVYYTWAAFAALRHLKSEPNDTAACVRWVNSLQNADGGFGDRPGWRSRLYSTYYAVETLAMLADDGDPRSLISRKQLRKQRTEPIPPGQFQIFQGLLKTPIVEAKDLPGLQERGLDLLGLKSNDFVTAAALQKAARSLRPPMEVVLSPEAYPHRSRRFGGPLLHHIANITLDPGCNDKQIAVWQAADAAGQKGLPWPDYLQRVIQPLRKSGSLFYPEQDFEMEFAYSAYDEGMLKQRGYNAMLTGFNWSPRDFVRVFPWRERYVDKLTPIADADSHGDLKKWSPQLDHTRMLFLAKAPTYADFQDAAADGRVVCVIHDSEGVKSRVTYYGRQPAVNYVERRVEEWKWWE